MVGSRSLDLYPTKTEYVGRRKSPKRNDAIWTVEWILSSQKIPRVHYSPAFNSVTFTVDVNSNTGDERKLA